LFIWLIKLCSFVKLIFAHLAIGLLIFPLKKAVIPRLQNVWNFYWKARSWYGLSGQLHTCFILQPEQQHL